MSLTPAGGKHQNKQRQSSPTLSSGMLLILVVSSEAAAITLLNPPAGVAIGVGLATVGLLCKIVR